RSGPTMRTGGTKHRWPADMTRPAPATGIAGRWGSFLCMSGNDYHSISWKSASHEVPAAVPAGRAAAVVGARALARQLHPDAEESPLSAQRPACPREYPGQAGGDQPGPLTGRV